LFILFFVEQVMVAVPRKQSSPRLEVHDPKDATERILVDDDHLLQGWGWSNPIGRQILW
jgi:hypothetical protein